MTVIIAVLLAFVCFLVFAYIDNHRLVVRKYFLRADIPEKSILKIVQISDIHKKNYPDNWNRLTVKIKELSPDVIFITGDLISRTETDFSYKGRLISELCLICPVYCSMGNHELDLRREVMDNYRKTIKESGGIPLENKSAQFEKNGVLLNIYGADLKRSVYRNEKNGFSGLESYTAEELHDIFGSPESLSVLLAHNPLFFESYAEWGADLIFSGHVHGGVVRFPMGILSPERKFFPKYSKGIYRKGKSRMIVSTGIGKLRLFNPSEILYAEILSDKKPDAS